MTASEAKRLSQEAGNEDGRHFKILLEYWQRAIKKAAEAGKTYVEEKEVDRPRMPISPAARLKVFAQLEADGYRVDRISDGPLSFSWVKVSW